MKLPLSVKLKRSLDLICNFNESTQITPGLIETFRMKSN